MPPKQIHNCDVIGEIGSGGMAIIYKAVQNSLNRPVAIKELRSDFSNDPQIVARFMREATALATLQHENIVHIYDFIKEDDSHRMIMEFVEGIDLFDLLDLVERIPTDIAMLIGLEVCRALEYAHYHGIIHRDIKPSNIIISRKGEVKLMDFGIARDENLGDLSRPGTSLGTPSYMSPEQIMGVKVDFRSDLFSFGIVLYQMVTGVKPFRDEGTKSIMHQIVATQYERPRKRNPDIPRWVERLIMRCLAKEPDDRFETTGQLRILLEEYLDRRVKMNHSGRLVAYLYHMDYLSREEAETLVAPKVLTDREIAREDEGLPRPLSIKTIAAVQGALGLALLIWILISHFALGGGGHSAAANGGSPGSLRVVAWPWAEIYIDGAYVETTPVARSFTLTPGVHEVELRHPKLTTESRKVLIEPERTQKLVITLKEKAP